MLFRKSKKNLTQTLAYLIPKTIFLAAVLYFLTHFLSNIFSSIVGGNKKITTFFLKSLATRINCLKFYTTFDSVSLP